jgi:hypothetical protein
MAFFCYDWVVEKGWKEKLKMCDQCKLCLETTDLSESHIIPKMFYRNVVKNSITGKMRSSLEVNKVVQDGVKLPFLCAECESLFSKYETHFSNEIYQKLIKLGDKCEVDTKDDKLRYFILSVAWRFLKWYFEVMPDEQNLTEEEIMKIRETLEHWRQILLEENFIEIRKQQMFLVPYDKITCLDKYHIKMKNGVAAGFRTLDSENQFNYATFSLKVPHLLLMCTIWGKSGQMKQYIVGKTIKVKDSILPKIVHAHFQFWENGFDDTASKISPEQHNKTKERYEREMNKRGLL